MASVLLEKDTPLPVISDIIGHMDTNSTAVYLKVDMKRLAECPLDFEEVIRVG
jgi:site-specific recombinase XerD